MLVGPKRESNRDDLLRSRPIGRTQRECASRSCLRALPHAPRTAIPAETNLATSTAMKH